MSAWSEVRVVRRGRRMKAKGLDCEVGWLGRAGTREKSVQITQLDELATGHHGTARLAGRW